MTTVVAVILNYRNWPDTLQVVESLEQQTLRPTDVVVVDNASGAAEAAAIQDAAGSRFHVLPLEANDGYAAGMNAGIRWATEKGAAAVLLLTHDIRLDPTCLERLAAEVAGTAVGVAAPVLGWQGRDNVTWSAGGAITRFTGTPFHPDKGRPLDAEVAAPTRSVSWADGAVLLVTRAALEAAGPLPEQYFLYYEEVDFQDRVRRSGRQVRVVSGALAWQGPGHTPRYLAARNQVLWLRRGRRWALPAYLLSVGYTCGRELVRRAVGRAPDLRLVVALTAGVRDGFTGRLRRELFPLA